MPRTYRAHAVSIASTSKELAATLDLPKRGPEMAKLIVGRREWISLPDLGISTLNAKTDSGAWSSCLHAENIQLSDDEKTVTFTTTNHFGESTTCQAPVARIGRVKSSTGIAGDRIFIQTHAVVPGGFSWPILISLSDRKDMLSPMLLGRRALAGYFLIDPQSAHLLGPKRQLPVLPAIPPSGE